LDKELKNELRRDEIGDALKEARAFLTRSDVVKPILAVLALFLVLAGLYYGQRFRVARADAAFARATEVFHAEVGTSATGATGGAATFKTAGDKFQKAKTMFDEVASSYGSMSAGRRARYYSALCLAELGQLSQAEAALKTIAALRETGALEPVVARLRLAEVVLRSGGRAKEAASMYQSMLDDEAVGLPRDLLLFGLAESLEASGDKFAARRAFTDLVNRHPQSPYAPDARKKMDELAPL
jgi:TolA-binding protein